MMKYPCPCCGYYVFENQTPGSYCLCPICYWTDEKPGTIDYMSKLMRAQDNFMQFGASEEYYIGVVRSPATDEQRIENWRALSEIKKEKAILIINEIEKAFHDDQQNGGVTLHQTIAIDNYATGEEIKKMREKDTDRYWREVKDEDLENISGVGGIPFLDDLGYRYYLPAYMHWFIRKYDIRDSDAGFSLINSMIHTDQIQKLDDMSSEQRNVLILFLNFIYDYYKKSDKITKLIEVLSPQ